MKKRAILLIFILLTAACSKDNSKPDLQDTSNYNADNKAALSHNEVKGRHEQMTAPEKNPRSTLYQWIIKILKERYIRKKNLLI